MDGQNQNDELYPIAVLIDELKVIGFAQVFYMVFEADLPSSMTMFFYA